MAPRFTYSRWDGTQRGFDLDADLLLDELTDELLYHGDVNAALRRMMQQGLDDPEGNRLPGIRELLEQLRSNYFPYHRIHNHEHDNPYLHPHL